MSSCWVLESCRTTATSCTRTAWWRWHRTALMQTPSSMGNGLPRRQCCVQVPHSSLVPHTSLSLWTRCMTKGGRRNQGPWWGPDTSLGESERSLCMCKASTYPHPFLFPLHFFLCTLSAHISKNVCMKRVCYCRWKGERMRFGVGRKKERWRKGMRVKYGVGQMEGMRKMRGKEEWRSFEVMAG